jgi:YihY family inner membrane protein
MRVSLMNITSWLEHKARRVWVILYRAAKTFWRIDGVQWAGSFAFNAFFSLFPLMILIVTIASFFVDQSRAEKVIIDYMQSYVSISGTMQEHVSETIAGVIRAREQTGAVVFVILIWAALQCFITLVCATNRAWDTADSKWWRLPIKSLVLLGLTGGAVFLSMGRAVLMTMTEGRSFAVHNIPSWVYGTGSFLIPLLAVFFGLSLFYWLAPGRRIHFSEVWAAALCATALLHAAASLFVIYIKDFATLNAVYGAFGGIMALLLWVYLSGCIFIFGACLCAAQGEKHWPRSEDGGQV